MQPGRRVCQHRIRALRPTQQESRPVKSDATAQCQAPGELVLPPRFETVGPAQQYLRAQGVGYVLAQFVDIHGVAKAKSVPVSHLPTVLGVGAGFAGFAIGGVGIEPHGPDFMAVGDLATLSLLPWQPGLARLVCDGHVAGRPWGDEGGGKLKKQNARRAGAGCNLVSGLGGGTWEYESGVTLKKQIARLAEHGYTLFSGLEPEFSLLRRDAHGVLGPADCSDNLAKPCYDYKGLSRTRAFL